MLNFYVLIMIFMFMVGGAMFTLKCNYLLMMLLSLEFMVLSLYFLLCIYFYLIESDYYFSMIFLSLSVCEGSLGISILISLIFSFGTDYFKSFSALC
nr:NADH dehydrogenase subunit 4L [Microrhagus sp. ZM-2022]